VKWDSLASSKLRVLAVPPRVSKIQKFRGKGKTKNTRGKLFQMAPNYTTRQHVPRMSQKSAEVMVRVMGIWWDRPLFPLCHYHSYWSFLSVTLSTPVRFSMRNRCQPNLLSKGPTTSPTSLFDQVIEPRDMFHARDCLPVHFSSVCPTFYICICHLNCLWHFDPMICIIFLQSHDDVTLSHASKSIPPTPQHRHRPGTLVFGS
jgi:hypothetical protein